jgi:hypothetical protein
MLYPLLPFSSHCFYLSAIVLSYYIFMQKNRTLILAKSNFFDKTLILSIPNFNKD